MSSHLIFSRKLSSATAGIWPLQTREGTNQLTGADASQNFKLTPNPCAARKLGFPTRPSGWRRIGTRRRSQVNVCAGRSHQARL